jgi:hypothetical protein
VPSLFGLWKKNSKIKREFFALPISKLKLRQKNCNEIGTVYSNCAKICENPFRKQVIRNLGGKIILKYVWIFGKDL